MVNGEGINSSSVVDASVSYADPIPSGEFSLSDVEQYTIVNSNFTLTSEPVFQYPYIIRLENRWYRCYLNSNFQWNGDLDNLKWSFSVRRANFGNVYRTWYPVHAEVVQDQGFFIITFRLVKEVHKVLIETGFQSYLDRDKYRLFDDGDIIEARFEVI